MLTRGERNRMETGCAMPRTFMRYRVSILTKQRNGVYTSRNITCGFNNSFILSVGESLLSPLVFDLVSFSETNKLRCSDDDEKLVERFTGRDEKEKCRQKRTVILNVSLSVLQGE